MDYIRGLLFSGYTNRQKAAQPTQNANVPVTFGKHKVDQQEGDSFVKGLGRAKSTGTTKPGGGTDNIGG